ncbi:MAG: DUF4157 domain-containing protein [Elainellaceae cyanobacterium]
MIQTKLTVGEPGDKYEQEADRTAAQIMRMPDPQAGEESEHVESTSQPQVQRKGGKEKETISSVEDQLVSQQGGGRPLPENVRSFMEPRFGNDFSGVRVHTDETAVQMNKELSAQAFTYGNNIYYGKGHSPGQDELTAHELTHTIQQGGETQLEDNTSSSAENQPSVQMRSEPPNSLPEQLSEEAEQPSQVETPEEFAESPAQTAEEAEIPSGSITENADASQELDEATDEIPDEFDVESEEKSSNESQNLEEPAETSTDREPQSSEQIPEAEGDEAEASPTEGLEDLPSDDLDLVDTELAEHQRWQSALEQVGTAGSSERGGFVANQLEQGFSSGVVPGLAAGVGMGLFQGGLNSSWLSGRVASSGMAGRITSTEAAQGAAKATATRIGSITGGGGGRAAASNIVKRTAGTAKLTPLPAIGAIVAGVISGYSLVDKWKNRDQVSETVLNFGKGSSKYETLANSIASISEIVDIISNVLNVIAGIAGVITAGMWLVAVASAGVLAPLAGTLTSISIGIGIATTALDLINAGILQPLVTLFRALHTYHSEADPREVMQSGSELSQAAQKQGGALAAFSGATNTRLGTRTSEVFQSTPPAKDITTYEDLPPMPRPSIPYRHRMGRHIGAFVRWIRTREDPRSDVDWKPVSGSRRDDGTLVSSHWRRRNPEEARRKDRQEDNSFYQELHDFVNLSSFDFVQDGGAANTLAGLNSPSLDEDEQHSQFPDDFQPQTGEERVNPNYPPPPASPEEIDAIREEIRQLQAERSLIAQAEREMERHQTDHEANQGPLQQTVECVETGTQANEQHGESVSETQEANQEQQERQQEAQGHIEDYSNHSSDLDTIRIPLRAFIGMAHLASYLPADAGEAMGQMRDESQEVLDSFTQMDESMETQRDTQPERREELQSDQQDLESTDDENTSTQEELQTANQDATQIQQQNDQNIQEAATQRESAAASGEELDGSIQEQEVMADTMSQQLQQWAVEHRQARLDALAQTEQQVTDQGMTVTEVQDI